VFASKERKAFNGLALAIIRSKHGQKGKITVRAQSNQLKEATAEIVAR
jgi:beta-galactosidase